MHGQPHIRFWSVVDNYPYHKYMCDIQKDVLWAVIALWQFFQAAVQILNLINMQLLIEYGPETEIFQHYTQQLCYNNVILVVY